MPNLLDLTGLAARWLQIAEFFASENDGEVSPEIMAELDSAELAMTDKLEACAALRENWLADADAMDKIAAHYAARAKADRKQAERMTEWMRFAMDANGIDKAVAGRYKLSIVANGGKAPMILADGLDVASLPEQYKAVTVAVDKAAIRAALEAGEVLEFAKIGERGSSLRIK